MTCPGCGAALPDGASVCPGCGAALAARAPARVAVPRDLADAARQFTGRLSVLAEAAAWMEDEAAERVLLVTGEPGSGKTALAAWLAGAGPGPEDPTLAGRLDRVRDAWSAAHFCVARGQRGTVNPSRFAQSLARQLSNRYPAYAEAAVTRIDPDYRIDQRVRENWGSVIGIKTDTLIITGRQPEDIYDVAVRGPLETLFADDPGLRVFILVDSLDESLTFEGGSSIASLLAGSADLPAGVRFLLTCRNNERRVLDAFDGARVLDLSAEGRSRDNDRDIRAYVRGWLAGNAAATSALPAGQSAAALEEQIVGRAEGNFLYVSFLMDEVAAGRRTLGDPAGLPSRLTGLYRTYLDRIVSGARDAGGAWLERYEPLLGSLGVAAPVAPRRLLAPWLGWTVGDVNVRMDDVAQITECFPEPLAGCRLYHRSMADFLSSASYEEKGAERPNLYYADPRRQHDRIARYYLDRARAEWGDDWGRAAWRDGEHPYPLLQLAGHLHARLALAAAERPPVSRGTQDALARELYDLVLNPTFREAQRRWSGSTHAALLDLRAALDVALSRDDLVPALRCIAAFRDAVRGQSITQTIYDEVDRGELARALEDVSCYAPASQPHGRWTRILHFYLAWEAAHAGLPDEARTIIETAEQVAARAPSDVLYEELADVLLVRTARVLAGGNGDPAAQLAALAPARDPHALLGAHPPPPPLGPQEMAAAARGLREEVARLEQLAAEGATEFVSGRPFLDEEQRATRAVAIRQALTLVARDPIAQQAVEGMLRPVLRNPYPRYRDVMLVALGIAAVTASEFATPSWARRQLREILRAGLDAEGVTFTFDLPSVLLEEARRRAIPAPVLEAYVAQARSRGDRWGTTMRARSAHSAALFWQGDLNAAWGALRAAGEMPSGFAGYASVALLALANRCVELGTPERAAEPLWGWGHDTSLLQGAAVLAANVVDVDFRQERMDLVAAYLAWRDQPVPDLAQARAALAAMPEPDVRGAYMDQLSARWVAASPPDLNGLKGLIPLALLDSTLLDALLGRLLGLRVRQHRAGERDLGDAELAELVQLCGEHFTSGRPWEMGEWR